MRTGQHRQAVRADLVRAVAVHGNAVGADDDEADATLRAGQICRALDEKLRSRKSVPGHTIEACYDLVRRRSLRCRRSLLSGRGHPLPAAR